MGIYIFGLLTLFFIAFMKMIQLTNDPHSAKTHKTITLLIALSLAIIIMVLCVLQLINHMEEDVAKMVENKEKYEEKYEGYTTLARFQGRSVSQPSLETCTDKHSVTYIDRHYKETDSILDAHLVICR